MVTQESGADATLSWIAATARLTRSVADDRNAWIDVDMFVCRVEAYHNRDKHPVEVSSVATADDEKPCVCRLA